MHPRKSPGSAIKPCNCDPRKSAPSICAPVNLTCRKSQSRKITPFSFAPSKLASCRSQRSRMHLSQALFLNQAASALQLLNRTSAKVLSHRLNQLKLESVTSTRCNRVPSQSPFARSHPFKRTSRKCKSRQCVPLACTRLHIAALICIPGKRVWLKSSMDSRISSYSPCVCKAPAVSGLRNCSCGQSGNAGNLVGVLRAMRIRPWSSAAVF